MLTELKIIGKSFFLSHRRWASFFLGIEAFFLAMSVIAFVNANEKWFSHLQQLKLIWLFVLPAIVFQTLLAVQLGLSFNAKSPEAWYMRLPFPRSSIHFFSYLLIWTNALVIYLPAFKAWGLFYELIAYPIAFGLILTPCLVFQLTSNIRRPLPGITIALVINLSLLMISFFAIAHYYYVEFPCIPAFNPLQTNVFFLFVTLLIVLLLDSQRQEFLRIASVFVLLSSAYYAKEFYQDTQTRNTEYFRHVKSLEARALFMNAECKAFEEKARKLTDPIILDANGEVEFKDLKQLLTAIEYLEEYPKQPISRKEVRESIFGLENQASARYALKSMQQVHDGCTIPLFSLLNPTIRTVKTLQALSPLERKEIIGRIWNVVQRKTNGSITLLDVYVSHALLRKLVDQRLVVGISQDRLAAISARLNERKTRSFNDLGSMEPYKQFHAPTNDRIRSFIREANKYEADFSFEIGDQLIELIEHAAPNTH